MTKKEILVRVVDIIDYDENIDIADHILEARLRLYLGEQLDSRRKDDFDGDFEFYREILMNFTKVLETGDFSLIE